VSERAGALPVIEGATVAPGHDGEAELVVTLRFPSGARDRVVLDADAGARLMSLAGAGSIAELAGADWSHLKHVLG
jgi:hypothetical protein